jgi:hypothetical protein
MESKEVISNIKQIYSNYGIPKNLQLHMLRTAAVAELIFDNLTCELEKENVLATMLLHDMGNVVKMQFDEDGLKLIDQEDLVKIEELKKMQKEFIKKYGDDDQGVNHAIAKEIGISKRLEELICKKSFHSACKINETSDLELWLCWYCDWRVGPFGILSLDNRLDDVKKRYTRKGVEIYKNKNVDGNKLDLLLVCAKKIEKKIFEKCKITPGDITDASIKKYLENY